MATLTGSTIRHQVFVSSTYLDLTEERRVVIEALLGLDCIPAGMEMFQAADEGQWDLIREVIDLSDYYVVIVGGRYGSLTAEGISFTEKEYDYADEQGIPVLGFIHEDPDSIPAGKTEIDKTAREKLDAFRAKVRTRPIRGYRDPYSLSASVVLSLTAAIKKHPRPGWVRGDLAMTDATRTQIAELRAELAEASQDAASPEDVIDVSYAHGEDPVELIYTARGSVGGNMQRKTVRIDTTWDRIVVRLGPKMVGEAIEDDLRDSLAEGARSRVLDETGFNWDYRNLVKISVADSTWSRIVAQLRALRIMDIGIKKRPIADSETYWRLTPAGDRYLAGLLAVRR